MTLRPIGVIRSELRERTGAPRQGEEGAPDAWLDVEAWAARGLVGVAAGDRLIVVTWLHRGRRDVLIGPIEAIDGTPVVDVKPAIRTGEA